MDGIDWTQIDWAKQKERERCYFAEREQKLGELRAIEAQGRVEKVAIMKAAGLDCNEDDPDYYMFHNPFVWMQSERHHPWAGIDYEIATRIFDVDARIEVAESKFREWCIDNDSWPPSSCSTGK